MIYLDVNAFYWYFGREKLPMPYSSLKLNVEKFRFFWTHVITKAYQLQY